MPAGFPCRSGCGARGDAAGSVIALRARESAQRCEHTQSAQGSGHRTRHTEHGPRGTRPGRARKTALITGRTHGRCNTAQTEQGGGQNSTAKTSTAPQPHEGLLLVLVLIIVAPLAAAAVFAGHLLSLFLSPPVRTPPQRSVRTAHAARQHPSAQLIPRGEWPLASSTPQSVRRPVTVRRTCSHNPPPVKREGLPLYSCTARAYACCAQVNPAVWAPILFAR